MDGFFSIIFFVLGACMGSFLHAASFRIAKKQDLVKGRSACPKCRQQLKWYDLIPVISFLVLKRKCRACGWKIPTRYLLVELATGLLFLSTGLYWLSQDLTMIYLIRDLFIVSVLLFLFIHDLFYYILPDIVTLPSIVLVVAMQLALGISWESLLLAILIGGGFFAFQFIVSKGKWIGGGDIRLGALMGAIVGWPAILIALLLAYLLGAFVSLFLVFTKKKDFGSMMPFGTFLTLSTLITIWWGEQILQWYIGLL